MKRLILLFALLPVLCYGVPNITSVTGVYVQGEQVQLIGTDFGVKTPAEPWLYRDWENGTNGQEIHDSRFYTFIDYDGVWPTYSSDSPRVSGHLSSKQGPVGDSVLDAINFPNGCNGGEIYFSGYFRGTIQGVDNVHSMKFINIADAVWTANGPVFRNGWGPNPPYGPYMWGNVKNCSGQEMDGSNGALNLTDNRIPYGQGWERWEFNGKHASGGGFWYTSRNNALIGNHADASFDFNCCFTHVLISSYMGDQYGPVTAWGYWDEVYIDITRARIEIGNESSFANCTHREIQIPYGTWVDGSLTFTFNVGTFTAGQTAYIFVIDSSGNHNTTGWGPVTIGSSQTQTMSYPESLQVNVE